MRDAAGRNLAEVARETSELENGHSENLVRKGERQAHLWEDIYWNGDILMVE